MIQPEPAPRYLIARVCGVIVGVIGVVAMVYLFDRPKAPAGAIAMTAALTVSCVAVVAVTWVGAHILAALGIERADVVAQEEWHRQQYQALSGQLSAITAKQGNVVAWARHRAAAFAHDLAELGAEHAREGADLTGIRHAQEIMRRDMDRLLLQYLSVQDAAETAKTQVTDVLRDLTERQSDLEEDFAGMRQRAINGVEPRLRLLPGEPS